MRQFLVVTAVLGLAGASCLPADTRPAPASVLLTVTTGDEPSVTTVDGWSITVDRLLMGIGDADFEFRQACERYSDSNYSRLVDTTLGKEQKVSISYGLGTCPFSFGTSFPSPDAVLGEGVTEADRQAMGGLREPGPDHPPDGVAVNFTATATRGAESKRMHWMFRQFTHYEKCSPRAADGTPLPLVLQSEDNLTLRTVVRGTVLFADDAKDGATTTAALRFDAMAAADTTPPGDGDGEVTLDELGKVTLEEARRSGGLYRDTSGTNPKGTLTEYLYLVLLARIVEFHETIVCQPTTLGPPPQ